MLRKYTKLDLFSMKLGHKIERDLNKLIQSKKRLMKKGNKDCM